MVSSKILFAIAVKINRKGLFVGIKIIQLGGLK
jgi:hypothetical protein